MKRENMQSRIKTRIVRLPQWLPILAILLLALASHAFAAETIPPSPPRYLNDDAHVLTPTVAEALNSKLADFERQTSNQIVVAIYPHMQSDSDMADYTTRVFHAWKVGQKDKNNGVVLFIFSQDHKLQIITGYGLEGALPDATCKQIIDEEITPRFKDGDFDTGVLEGVNAIIAATRGEYHGTGHIASQHHGLSDFWIDVIIAAVFFVFVLIVVVRAGAGSGWHLSGISFGSSSSSRSSSSSGSSSSDSSSDSDSGSDFSGGGGDTGGGGAGGSW
jgi:uncharacterized protein